MAAVINLSVHKPITTKKSPRTPSIVQVIFLFRSFEISNDIQNFQNTHV